MPHLQNLRRGFMALSLLIGLAVLPCNASGAQQDSSDAAMSHPAKASVQYLFPEQITVEAGKPSTAELHFRIAPGLHINSHTPHTKFLIPTSLVVVEQPGIKVAAVNFPAGQEFSFPFSPDEKLSIYSDEFVLQTHLTATRGDHLLQGALRYQACDSNSCYPPKTIPVAIDVIAR